MNDPGYEAFTYLKKIRARMVPVKKDGTAVVPVRCGDVEIYVGRKYVRMKWFDRERSVLHKFSGNICQAADRLAELEPEISPHPSPSVTPSPQGEGFARGEG